MQQNKVTKILVMIALLLLLLLSLSSCGTIDKKIKLSSHVSEIQTIEIYHIESNYSEGDVSALREENTSYCSVAPTDYDAFLNELTSLPFSEEIPFFPMTAVDGGYDYSGYIISIVYADNSYDLIAEKGQFFYSIGDNGDGKYSYDTSNYHGEVAWTDFVEKYVQT